MMRDLNAVIRYFLFLCILFGLFIRFYSLEEPFLYRDDALNVVSAIKLNHDNNPYDPRFYMYEHPPIARWIMGLPARFIEADYSLTMSVPPQMFVYSYMAPYKETYIAFRSINAIAGALGVLFIFLVAKKAYGNEAALWSGAIAALSFDLLTYSRALVADVYFFLFFLTTLYFYIVYSESKGKFKMVYLILAFASLTISLGTRNYNPLFLFPALLLCHFFFNRNKDNVLFIYFTFVSLYVFAYIIYPPEVRAPAQELWKVKSPLDLSGFSLPNILIFSVVRHSYIFAFSFILVIYEFARDGGKLLKATLKKGSPQSIMVLFSLVYFVGLGFTKVAGRGPHYSIPFFLLIMILAGNVLAKIKNRTTQILAVVLLALNIYQVILAFPYFGEYSNFGKLYWLTDHKGYSDHVPALEEAISYLNKLGTPQILTNEHNMLIFYNGISLPLVASYEQRCSSNYLSDVINTTTYIIYYGGYGGQGDLRQDPYVCPILRAMPIEFLQSFGDYKGENPESLKVKIYKINSGK